MRIIAGKFKGHQLVTFSASHIRPTTDRVKESLFNIIAADVDGSGVIDLFSGTGNLGLEALSRGANAVTFVEKNSKSIHILKQNIKKLGVESQSKIVAQDVILFLNRYSGEPFDIVFADPPFTETMAHDVLLAADKSKIFSPQTIMTIESAKKERLDKEYENLIMVDQRLFGDKILSFFRLKG